MITEIIETASTILYTTRNESICDPYACPIRELAVFARRGTPSYREIYNQCMEQRFQEPMDQIKVLTELSAALGQAGIFSVDCPNADTSLEPGLTCGNVVGVNLSRFRTTGRMLKLLSGNAHQEGDQNG
jgi:hypothetical protein